MLLHDILDRSAARHPKRIALRCRDRQVTYEELRLTTARTAGGLVRLGVARGDRVAVSLPNRIELVELIFACSRVGAVCVLINPTLKPRQVRHVLNDSGSSVLVSDRALPSQMVPVVQDCSNLRSIVAIEVGVDVDLPGVSVSTLEKLRAADPATPVRLIDADVAALFYTSGSSGRAKGVTVSHRNLVSGAECVSAYLENTADDRILAVLPLSFDYGFSQVSTALHVGACAVLTNYLSPAALVQEIQKEAITGLAGVPFIWSQLAATIWPAPPESLRYVTNSGGVLGQPVIKALSQLLPTTRIFCMYGLTEAFRSTFLDPRQLWARSGSIGKAVPNQEILVLRPDGTRCAANEIGELVHRGSFVTLGYWNDPELTAQRFRPLPAASSVRSEVGVWSGDLVRQDVDGYLYFVGRADDQIKSSGVRVSPTEVEEVVAEVEGVRETVVTGVADDALGQVIAVAVVGSNGDSAALGERIREHCRQCLPMYMIPSILHFLPALPRTENGKPDRVTIRQLLASVSSRDGERKRRRDSTGPDDA
jgi:acyl-CoA ligase (AMP-forming) (exosortase A-associated)